MTKFVVGQWLCLVLILALGQAQAAAVTPAPEVEQSTESPIADMALIEDAPMAPKSPTEKPPVQEAAMEKAPAGATPVSVVPVAAPGQTHTVADFIIHPLIAFKPRQASLEEIQGKQAATPAAGTPASPSTWLFGMNPAQQLGSSFSTLAGSVSGWINDRLGQQLPSFVETPVRTESTTTTPAPGTTTTQKPDIVVRVQQRPQRNGNRRGGNGGNGNGNGNGNFNGNGLGGNGNGNGNRRRQRPNRFNNRLDSFEDDYYEDDYFQGNRFDEEFDDDEDDLSLEHFEDDDSLELRPQQKPKRKQTQSQSQSAAQKPKRKQQKPQPQQEHEQEQESEEEVAQVVTHKRRQSQNKKPKTQKKPVQVQEDSDDEEELEDDEHEDDDDEEVQDDESQEQDFLPEPIFGSSSSSRRSQTQPNFIQRGQQSLISQIRQFTRGQTPAEVGNKLRRTSVSGSGSAQTRRPQQATLLVNRNGQTVYVAPELLGLNQAYPYAYQGKRQRVPAAGAFPQPPLTVPVRRQGRPTQYITIPWNQLGLSPPERQTMVSLAEGIQAQPLILNIPESAIQPVRGASGQQQKKKKRPQLTASAVPLLADASLMDIFQPPQIPPSRTGSSTASAIKPINAQPVLIAAKPVKAGGSGVLPTRIRPGTIVEKAPAMDMAMEKPAMEATEAKQEEEQQQMMMPAAASTETAAQLAAPEQQEFIIVGDDDEPGLSRHVQPAYGDARYVSYGDFHPYFDLLTQNRRFALRKSGRSLESPEVVQKEIKMEEPLKEEMKKEEPLKEEIKKEEPMKEEIIMKEEMKKDELKKEEMIMKEEPPKEEMKKEELKKEEIKMEEAPKKEEPQVPALAL